MNPIRSGAIALLSTVILPHSVAAVSPSTSSAGPNLSFHLARDVALDLAQEVAQEADLGQPEAVSADFSTLELAIINEMNRARTNPNSYADWLERQRRFFNGNILNLPGEDPVETQEGTAALDEAILYLRSLRPLFPFSRSDGMSRGARDLVADQGQSGEEGHTNSDGLGFAERLSQYGSFSGGAAENLSYSLENASSIVMMLVLDDGEPSRGHRNKIFNLDFRTSGVACGTHPNRAIACAINYAGTYDESNPGIVVRPPVSPPPTFEDPQVPDSEILVLENGRLADGDLVYPDDGSLYDEYRFSGRAGQKIVISLESTDFDPFLAFLNEKRDVLGQNDDESEGNQNSRLAITLPYDGVYYIFVNGYDSQDRGEYILQVRPQTSVEEATP
ncbi:MAG: pre-peptidase C-terminal domain-containing protein [Cyanobacteria bacterium P01_E01_bin.42]